MKKRLFSFISIVIGIVVALATVELMAIGWLYVEDGHHTPAAELFERAATLRAEARAFRERFNRDFWLEDQRFFALGLDADAGS